jgi:hypothetical protein
MGQEFSTYSQSIISDDSNIGLSKFISDINKISSSSDNNFNVSDQEFSVLKQIDGVYTGLIDLIKKNCQSVKSKLDSIDLYDTDENMKIELERLVKELNLQKSHLQYFDQKLDKDLQDAIERNKSYTDEQKKTLNDLKEDKKIAIRNIYDQIKNEQKLTIANTSNKYSQLKQAVKTASVGNTLTLSQQGGGFNPTISTPTPTSTSKLQGGGLNTFYLDYEHPKSHTRIKFKL